VTGRLIAVVGPSGVGKDTVMEAMSRAEPRLALVRRVITRDPALGGEAFEAVTQEDFDRRREAGEFALDWTAHGLSYGIPALASDLLAQGKDMAANLSRSVLDEARDRFGHVVILNLSARPEVLARRLDGRGRETSEDVARRLSRPAPEMPPDVARIELDNSGALSLTVATALAALYPDRATR
jgi:ribose 1,5-bisphosphokinase